MRLSSLLAAEVISEDGSGLGHVHDVRVRRLGHRNADGFQFRVTGLVIGSRGIRERIGLDTAASDAETVDRDFVPWEHVIEVDGAEGRIVVRLAPNESQG